MTLSCWPLCGVGDWSLVARSDSLWCLDFSRCSTVHCVNTQPLCYQCRPILRHQTSVQVRHEEDTGSHGSNDRCRLGPVSCHQHSATVRLESRGQTGRVRGQSTHRLSGKTTLITLHNVLCRFNNCSECTCGMVDFDNVKLDIHCGRRRNYITFHHDFCDYSWSEFTSDMPRYPLCE